MIRTFHAIGQGAFYTEKFDNGFTVVYDCGGQNKSFIEEKIKEVFSENETIDILFISHFHNDHINGLEFLLKYCDVKEVVLPFLHDNMKLQFVLENVKSGTYSQYMIDTIINPEKRFEKQKLTLIEPIEIDINSMNIDAMINSSKIRSKYISGWIYIPYNIYNDKFAKDLEQALKLESIDINNIKDKLKADKKKITEIYKQTCGRENFNVNSLIIYSGLEKNTNLKLQNITFVSNEIITSNKIGCLYLGDAELKENSSMQKLKHLFNSYWQDISATQIPHHGSYKNYNSDLSWKDSISIISTGFRYSHPSTKVIDNIKSNNSICAVVSYDKNSQVIQNINLEYVLHNYHPEYLI